MLRGSLMKAAESTGARFAQVTDGAAMVSRQVTPAGMRAGSGQRLPGTAMMTPSAANHWGRQPHSAATREVSSANLRKLLKTGDEFMRVSSTAQRRVSRETYPRVFRQRQGKEHENALVSTFENIKEQWLFLTLFLHLVNGYSYERYGFFS
jgi:hypothetical protein